MATKTLGRTPQPVGTVKMNYRLTDDEFTYVEALVKSTGKSLTEVYAREMDWVRTWGLTATRLPRLLAAAKAQGVDPTDFVGALVEKFAAALPRVVPKPASPKSLRQHIGGCFISGPVHAMLTRYGMNHGLDGVAGAFYVLLNFGREYGLSRPNLAALEAYAEAKGVSVRDIVQDLINDAVAAMPEPQTPPTTSRRRHG